MTAEQIAVIVLLVALGGICLTGLAIAGRWIMSRVEASADVERFANAITPENADVVAQQRAFAEKQREAMVAEMCDLLDEAMADLDALVAEETAAVVDEVEALLDDCAIQVRRMGRRAAAA